MSQMYPYAGTKPEKARVTGGGAAQEWLSCDICNLTFKNQQHLSIHFGGVFHANRVTASRQPKQAGDTAKSSTGNLTSYLSSNNPSYWTDMQQDFPDYASADTEQSRDKAQIGKPQDYFNQTAATQQSQVDYISYPIGKQSKQFSEGKKAGTYEGLYGMPGFGWTDTPGDFARPDGQAGNDKLTKDFQNSGTAMQGMTSRGFQQPQEPTWLKMIEPAMRQVEPELSGKGTLYGEQSLSSSRGTGDGNQWGSKEYDYGVSKEIRQAKGDSYRRADEPVRSQTRWDPDNFGGSRDSLSLERRKESDNSEYRSQVNRRRDDDNFNQGEGSYRDRGSNRNMDDLNSEGNSYRKQDSSRKEEYQWREENQRKSDSRGSFGDGKRNLPVNREDTKRQEDPFRRTVGQRDSLDDRNRSQDKRESKDFWDRYSESWDPAQMEYSSGGLKSVQGESRTSWSNEDFGRKDASRVNNKNQMSWMQPESRRPADVESGPTRDNAWAAQYSGRVTDKGGSRMTTAGPVSAVASGKTGAIDRSRTEELLKSTLNLANQLQERSGKGFQSDLSWPANRSSKDQDQFLGGKMADWQNQFAERKQAEDPNFMTKSQNAEIPAWRRNIGTSQSSVPQSNTAGQYKVAQKGAPTVNWQEERENSKGNAGSQSGLGRGGSGYIGQRNPWSSPDKGGRIGTESNLQSSSTSSKMFSGDQGKVGQNKPAVPSLLDLKLAHVPAKDMNKDASKDKWSQGSSLNQRQSANVAAEPLSSQPALSSAQLRPAIKQVSALNKGLLPTPLSGFQNRNSPAAVAENTGKKPSPAATGFGVRNDSPASQMAKGLFGKPQPVSSSAASSGVLISATDRMKPVSKVGMNSTASKLDSKVTPSSSVAETKMELKSSTVRRDISQSAAGSVPERPVSSTRPVVPLSSSGVSAAEKEPSKTAVAQKSFAPVNRNKKKEDIENTDECDPALSEALGHFFSEAKDATDNRVKPAISSKVDHTKPTSARESVAVKSLNRKAEPDVRSSSVSSQQSSGRSGESKAETSTKPLDIKIKEEVIDEGYTASASKAPGDFDPIAELSSRLPPDVMKKITTGQLSADMLEKVASLLPANVLEKAVEYLQGSVIQKAEATKTSSSSGSDAKAVGKVSNGKDKETASTNAKDGKTGAAPSRVQVIKPRQGLPNTDAGGSIKGQSPLKGKDQPPSSVVAVKVEPTDDFQKADIPTYLGRKYDNIDPSMLTDLNFDEMLLLFQELLQDVLGSLFKDDKPATAIIQKGILETLSADDRDLALQMQKMTGISDLSKIVHTLNVLKSLNTDTILTLGQLDKSVVASSLRGNKKAQDLGGKVLQQLTDLMAKGSSSAARKPLSGSKDASLGSKKSEQRSSVGPAPKTVGPAPKRPNLNVKSLMDINCTSQRPTGAAAQFQQPQLPLFNPGKALLPTPGFPPLQGMMGRPNMGMISNFPQSFPQKRGRDDFFGGSPPAKRWR